MLKRKCISNKKENRDLCAEKDTVIYYEKIILSVFNNNQE